MWGKFIECVVNGSLQGRTDHELYLWISNHLILTNTHKKKKKKIPIYLLNAKNRFKIISYSIFFTEYSKGLAVLTTTRSYNNSKSSLIFILQLLYS